MRKIVVLASAVALVLGLPTAALAPHSGCRAVAPSAPKCTYKALGDHTAIVLVVGKWQITGAGGRPMNHGDGPVGGTVAVKAAADEEVTVEILGTAGVLSSGTSAGHP